MTDSKNMPPDPATSYGIGSVSRLTGLSTHTLRAWEKRHRAVEAHRDAAGRRRYTVADVERLTRLKQLVDLGERIGDLARLSAQSLEQRLADAKAHATTRAPRTAPVRIGIFGPAARSHRKAFQKQPGEYVVELISTATESSAVQDQMASLDCLVLDCASLGPDDASSIEQLTREAARCAVVLICGFGRDADLRRLGQCGVTIVTAPASAADLRRAVDMATRPMRRAADVQNKEAPAKIMSRSAQEPRFTTAELSRLATLSTDIECECPHHLVSLIGYLRAFEQYSADCENRNAEDAAMHKFLHAETRRATQIIENGLRRLIDFEGIDIGQFESEQGPG